MFGQIHCRYSECIIDRGSGCIICVFELICLMVDLFIRRYNQIAMEVSKIRKWSGSIMAEQLLSHFWTSKVQ